MRKGVFLIVLCFLLVSFIRNALEFRNSMMFYQTTKKNWEKEVNKNKELTAQERKSNSHFEIEKNLRNKQNLTRKDEIMVIVPPPTPTPTPFIIPTQPIYKEWLSLFMH